MPVHVTFHHRDVVVDKGGNVIGVLGPQIGNAAALSVEVSATTSPPSAPNNCFVHIKATEDCRIAIGSAAHASNSEYWMAGESDIRAAESGQIISVIASA